MVFGKCFIECESYRFRLNFKQALFYKGLLFSPLILSHIKTQIGIVKIRTIQMALDNR